MCTDTQTHSDINVVYTWVNSSRAAFYWKWTLSTANPTDNNNNKTVRTIVPNLLFTTRNSLNFLKEK